MTMHKRMTVPPVGRSYLIHQIPRRIIYPKETDRMHRRWMSIILIPCKNGKTRPIKSVRHTGRLVAFYMASRRSCTISRCRASSTISRSGDLHSRYDLQALERNQSIRTNTSKWYRSATTSSATPSMISITYHKKMIYPN